METQSQWNKISEGDIYYPKRDMSSSNTEWSHENPTSRWCQISKITSGSQTKLEKTYIYIQCKQFGL